MFPFLLRINVKAIISGGSIDKLSHISQCMYDGGKERTLHFDYVL